jgi:hypothetical protein
MEIEKLKLLLEGIIDSSVIDRLYELNGKFPEPKRSLQTAIDALNYAILQLETVKVGELSIDQKEKLNALRELRNQLQKDLETLEKPKYGVFYVDKPKKEL